MVNDNGDARSGPRTAPGQLASPMTYEPRATQQARRHVYRVRLDDLEMAGLQTLARQRSVSVSVVLRELIHEALRGAGADLVAALGAGVKLTED